MCASIKMWGKKKKNQHLLKIDRNEKEKEWEDQTAARVKMYT